MKALAVLLLLCCTQVQAAEMYTPPGMVEITEQEGMEVRGQCYRFSIPKSFARVRGFISVQAGPVQIYEEKLARDTGRNGGAVGGFQVEIQSPLGSLSISEVGFAFTGKNAMSFFMGR
jgi:hypothetical protein